MAEPVEAEPVEAELVEAELVEAGFVEVHFAGDIIPGAVDAGLFTFSRCHG